MANFIGLFTQIAENPSEVLTNMSLAFRLANTTAMACWLVLSLSPVLGLWVARRVTGVVVPFLLALVYAVLLFSVLSTGLPPGASFSTLDGLSVFFSDPKALLAGWVHYLCFDMVIGSWIVRDANANGVSFALVLPCLFFTLMAGPVGWALYLLLRTLLAAAPLHAKLD